MIQNTIWNTSRGTLWNAQVILFLMITPKAPCYLQGGIQIQASLFLGSASNKYLLSLLFSKPSSRHQGSSGEQGKVLSSWPLQYGNPTALGQTFRLLPVPHTKLFALVRPVSCCFILIAAWLVILSHKPQAFQSRLILHLLWHSPWLTQLSKHLDPYSFSTWLFIVFLNSNIFLRKIYHSFQST